MVPAYIDIMPLGDLPAYPGIQRKKKEKRKKKKRSEPDRGRDISLFLPNIPAKWPVSQPYQITISICSK